MDTKVIFQANRQATARMQQIVDGLSEQELSMILPNGWSITVTLAHLAFWDQRVIHGIGIVKKAENPVTPYIDDQLNDILTPFLAAIPPEKAAGMATEIANRLDVLLEECPPELIERLMTLNHRWVERSLHRNDHLNDIENFLKLTM